MIRVPFEWARLVSSAERPSRPIPLWLHIIGAMLRIVFIVCLLAVTVRVSMPQSETIWTAYETPADLVRMVLGLTVCTWIAIQLFRTPKDAQAYKTWIYLGLAAVPFAVICTLGVWGVR
jgi:hypothetical protein